MQKFTIILTLVLFVTSCSDDSLSNKERHNKYERTLLTTSFNPAFNENSEIVYSVNDLHQTLSIFLKCKDDRSYDEDTFFYSRKTLTDSEIRFLDSTLVKIIPIPTIDRKDRISDGITIYFNLVKNGDTVNRHFTSPSKKDNPLGYIVTSKAINAFRTIFDDPIVSGYFDDVRNYIDDTTIIHTSKDRLVDQLRVKKYGWQLRRE